MITEPIHYSTLKAMALSPSHFKAALTTKFEPTRSMRIGTIVHHILLGKSNNGRELVCFEGDARRGKAWDAFAAEHADCEIVTQPEWDEAGPIANAVLRDPVVNEHGLLSPNNRFEVPLEWNDAGVPRRTRGVDIIGDGWIADLKTTQTAHPARFQRLATNMLYHCQLADYEAACTANGIDTSKGKFIIGVETDAPYPVTVFRLTEPVLEHGRRTVAKWIEQLRGCVENDFWPGYTQTVVDLELPSWMEEGDDA